MRDDRKIARGRSEGCPTASNSIRIAQYAGWPPPASTRVNVFASENRSSRGYRRSRDRPTSKVVDPLAHEILPATKDKAAGPNRDWKGRCSAVAWCTRL